MSTERNGGWRRIEEDGAEWEARLVASPDQRGGDAEAGDEMLEFVCVDGSRRPRRVLVSRDSDTALDENELRRAYRRSRPIGGDHYGRPGKPTNDVA